MVKMRDGTTTEDWRRAVNKVPRDYSFGNLVIDLCNEIDHLHDEIRKYRERLEVDHLFEAGDEYVPWRRVEVPYKSADDDIGSTDGISCRDATIELQDETIKRMRANG